MKIRYKKSNQETYSHAFNMSSLSEVLTGDDSPCISELDVWLDKKQEWKDMREAFKDHDLITDDYNTVFFEPQTEESRRRGYTL